MKKHLKILTAFTFLTLSDLCASAEDIARICHGHPTYSEAIKEAALAATADRALHV